MLFHTQWGRKPNATDLLHCTCQLGWVNKWFFHQYFLQRPSLPLPLLSFQITLPNSHNAHTVCAYALYRSVYLMIFYLFISALFLVNLTFTSITFRLVDQVKSNCVCPVNNATARMLENVIKSCVVFWSGTHFHFLIVCCVIVQWAP